MKELHEIKVIENNYKSVLKEKGSRFLSFAFPVDTEEEAISILEKLKKEFYDASHHCYAYKLKENLKYSDAGEPSGTVGVRIFNAVEHFELTNILVVVIRYFGGTKLGAGGLGKAYYESSLNVLQKALIKKKFLYRKIFIKVDFQLVQKVYHLFNDSYNKILNTGYSDQANFECLVKPELLDQLMEEIRNISAGKVEIMQSELVYY
jgi:uncharacterized YigZ family protein